MRIFCIGILIILMVPFHGAAQDFDGSKPLVCSAVEVFECAPGEACVEGLAEEFDFPHFIRIDFKSNLLTGKTGDQTEETSPIDTVQTMEGNLILHGSQNGRAWNIVLSQTTGKMTGTIAADGFTFSVFGACTVD